MTKYLCYYWPGPTPKAPNFGDALNPWLLSKYGVQAKWAPEKKADLFAIGSILQLVPPKYEGTVWSTGLKFNTSHPDLSQARVLALRGQLTADRVNVKCEVLGDGALLVKEFAPQLAKTWKVGIIAHWQDSDLKTRGHVIDVRSGVENVIREAAQCETIIASSLHGLVLADALQIPSKWVPAPNLKSEGWFKISDYASAWGQRMEPDEWRDPFPVDEKVRELQESLAELHE